MIAPIFLIFFVSHNVVIFEISTMKYLKPKFHVASFEMRCVCSVMNVAARCYY